MQYIRRRIQRVSGVIVRDERVESRDFSIQSRWEHWDELSPEQRERAAPKREMRAFDRQGVSYRERT